MIHYRLLKTLNIHKLQPDYETESRFVPKRVAWSDPRPVSSPKRAEKPMSDLSHKSLNQNKMRLDYETGLAAVGVWLGCPALSNRTTAGDCSAAVVVDSEVVRSESGRDGLFLAFLGGDGSESGTGQGGGDHCGGLRHDIDIEAARCRNKARPTGIPGTRVVYTGACRCDIHLCCTWCASCQVEQVKLAKGQVVNGGRRRGLIWGPAGTVIDEVSGVFLVRGNGANSIHRPISIWVECLNVADAAEGEVADGDIEIAGENQAPGSCFRTCIRKPDVIGLVGLRRIELAVVQVLGDGAGGDAGARGCGDQVFHSLGGLINGDEPDGGEAQDVLNVFSDDIHSHIDLPLSDESVSLFGLHCNLTGISAQTVGRVRASCVLSDMLHRTTIPPCHIGKIGKLCRHRFT